MQLRYPLTLLRVGKKSDGNDHNKLLISVLISAFVIVSKLFSRAKADPSAGLMLYKIEWHA